MKPGHESLSCSRIYASTNSGQPRVDNCSDLWNFTLNLTLSYDRWVNGWKFTFSLLISNNLIRFSISLLKLMKKKQQTNHFFQTTLWKKALYLPHILEPKSQTRISYTSIHEYIHHFLLLFAHASLCFLKQPSAQVRGDPRNRTLGFPHWNHWRWPLRHPSTPLFLYPTVILT